MQDAIALEAFKQRVAVPWIEQRAERVGVGRLAAVEQPETKEGGEDLKAEVRARGHEILDRGEHAVAGTALLRSGPRIRQPTGADSADPGVEPASRGDRLSVLGRDAVGVVVVVAPPVGPADVVERQQREPGALLAPAL